MNDSKPPARLYLLTYKHTSEGWVPGDMVVMSGHMAEKVVQEHRQKVEWDLKSAWEKRVSNICGG